MATSVMTHHSHHHVGRAGNTVLWILQILGALMFFMAGIGKLAGAEMHVQLFESIGIGQWFRYVTGLIEAGSAVLLLTPSLSGVGALLLACTMFGAVITHLFVIGGSPGTPLVLLAAMVLVAYGRREHIQRLFEGRRLRIDS